jgi:hypothetical protein
MSDVFSKAKRSEVMARIRSPQSESFEVEVFAAEAEVFDDVGYDSARHIARMPGEGDKTVGMERIRVVTVAARRAEQLASDLTQATFQLAAVPRGILAHKSRGENEFVAESGWDGASGFQQRLQMGLGGLLEAQDGLAPVLPVRMAAGQQGRFRNPYPVLVAPHLNFRDRNDHRGNTLTRRCLKLKSLHGVEIRSPSCMPVHNRFNLCSSGFIRG